MHRLYRWKLITPLSKCLSQTSQLLIRASLCLLQITSSYISSPSVLFWSTPLQTWECKKLIPIPWGIPDYRQYGNCWISPFPHFGHSMHNLNKIQQLVKDSSTESSPRCPQGWSSCNAHLELAFLPCLFHSSPALLSPLGSLPKEMTCIQVFVLGFAFLGGNLGGYSGCEKIYHFWGSHFEDFGDEMTWSLGLALNISSIYKHCGRQYGEFSENQKYNYHMTQQVHLGIYPKQQQQAKH